MGEKYNMTDEELKTWRYSIYKAITDYKNCRLPSILYMIIIWIYEYIEAVCVNNTDNQAKLGRIKSKYPNSEAITKLFRLRGNIVHNCYKIEDEDIKLLFSKHKDLDFILTDLGFEIPICNVIYTTICTGHVSLDTESDYMDLLNDLSKSSNSRGYQTNFFN